MKRLMTILLMLVVAISIYTQTPAPKEGDKTGTTTNDTVMVDSLYPGRFAVVGITFENTGSDTHDISYWVKAYRSEDSTNPCRTWTATDLSDDAIVNIEFENVYYKLTIETESTVDGDHSTYEFSYAMRYF